MKRVGFRAIDNDYFAALMAGSFTRAEYKVVLAVIHKTMGWQREWSEGLSLSEFTRLTGLSRQAVIDAIRQLEAKHVVEVRRDGQKTASYSILHWQEWDTTGKARLTTDGKAHLTSEKPKTLPASGENLTRTSQVVESATTCIKEKGNSLKKPSERKGDDINNLGSQGGNTPLPGKSNPFNPWEEYQLRGER